MSYYNIISLMSPKVTYDPDALAFILASGITNNTQKDAVNTLVVSLKSNGLWTKMKAIYPFVGGTATTHKFNLKDARDLDAAFRLQFLGGWTHSSTGALPSIIGNTMARTFLSPFNQLGANSNHLSFYSRTNDMSGNNVDIGSIDNDATTSLPLMVIKNTLTDKLIGWNPDYNTTNITATVANSLGLNVTSRIAVNSHKIYKNGTSVGSNTANRILNLPTSFIGIGGAITTSFPNGTAFTNKEVSFASIGDGLTDSDVTNLYSVVQIFQTSLSRQV